MSLMDLYECCELCPRMCQVDRTRGEHGQCGEGATVRLSTICPHFGEEPSFSGTRGSGTIFFSGCACGCFFCQNHQISLAHSGRTLSPAELARDAKALLGKGVHNLNLVTADHFLPHVVQLCRALRRNGISVPVLFNCSGYARPEMISLLAQEAIDVFLPDFKFADAALAEECMGDSSYPELAPAAIETMYEHKGPLKPWDPSGQIPADSGVLVRHLVLPGRIDNSFAVLAAVHEKLGPDLPLSIMSQFRPTPSCAERGVFRRPVTKEEYEQVCDFAEILGFTHVYTQPEFGDRAFLPDFDREEPFRGNARDH